MDLLKNKHDHFTPEELAVKKVVKKDTGNKEVEKVEIEQAIDLERYKDQEGITVKSLDTGFWLIKNKRNFILVRNVFLGVLGIVLWGFFLSAFGTYFVFGMKQDSAMLNRLTQNFFPSHNYFTESSPKNLAIDNVQIFEFLPGRYDFLTEVKNPNPNHWVEIEYALTGGEKVIENNKATILPGASKYVLALGRELDWRPSEVSFKITALHWHRIDPHKYGNWNDYRGDRLDGIIITDTDISLASENALSEKVDLNSVNFKVKNNTSFNYAEASFVILLSTNSRVVSVYRYVLEDFYSGLEKDVSIIFPGQVTGIDKIEIVPDINIVDNNIFSKFKGEGFTK
ncbi:hypothetical protein L6270_04860 [Candidatus Parcubacteria bacterium]|nr:hypothetical protein [Patescibacteria group bacterium]MBU4309292.1 hypothetical protein [Patescibacteria group bacterium]MBU4432269.1 hypothetical protein [Patescibacteria group bacterium]MBU4577653.1 hypothetical protein [Patescibacteria group bacterium]MCG2697339.1 hypothetical protein [Candidatus Parcubacteria bacterium]